MNVLPINKTISIIERFNLMYRDKQFEQFGLHGYQASFLIEIVRNPKLTQEQLTKNMHLDKSNIARGCQALKKHGYIEINKKVDDRRFVELQATAKGSELSTKIVDILKKQRAFIMQDFDDASETQFLEYLEWLKERAMQLLELEGEQ